MAMAATARSEAPATRAAPAMAAVTSPVDDECEVDKSLGQRMAPYLEMARIENVPAAYMFVMGGAAIATEL